MLDNAFPNQRDAAAAKVKKISKSTVVLRVFAVIVIVLGTWVVRGLGRRAPSSKSEAEQSKAGSDMQESEAAREIQPLLRVPLPEEVRGVYWTAGTAGGKRAQALLEYMRATSLNTVVIDLKMDDGEIAFAPHDETLAPYALAEPHVKDLDKLLEELAKDSIYKIARIGVMRDSEFADVHKDIALRSAGGGLWSDKTKSYWLDPAAPEIAEYAIALGREAYARGFDEVQYDYVRFPSDGTVNAIHYPIYDRKRPKEEVMKDFFQKVGGALKQESIPVSFDLFGLAMVAADGIGVGQRITDVSPVADFISPMVYPSHYARGFRGHANPALFPYDVVKGSLDKGIAQLVAAGYTEAEARKMFRPWLQDFDIGAKYTADMIEEQIRAARDAGVSGWMLWNARNVYEPAEYLSDEDGNL